MLTVEVAWHMPTAFLIGREHSSCAPVSVGMAAAAWPSMLCTKAQLGLEVQSMSVVDAWHHTSKLADGISV